MKKILIGLAIFFLAFFFRFNNLNWDSGFHLHPDERFLTMVGNAMKLPVNINQYFNPQTSGLNPANVGFTFFVYGRFPSILSKYLAVGANMDNYNDLTILGRALSAFFDLMIVILVYKTVELFEKSGSGEKDNKALTGLSTKYWAAFFYAVAVLPIQLSHFFATDTFLNFFMFGSFYFALRYSMGGKKNLVRFIFLSALFFGLAMACKITAIFILPLVLFFLIKTVLKKTIFIKTVFKLGIFFLVSYFTLRLADPYLFKSANFFNPAIDPNFIASIKSLSSYLNKNIWYPPGVQWINKNPLPFSVMNLAVFGVGIPYFIIAIVGIVSIIFNFQFSIFSEFSKKKNEFFKKITSIKSELIVILIWVLAFIVYQGIQFNPGMRYFLIIYPFLAIFAGIGISNFFVWLNQKTKSKAILYTSYFILTSLLLIWPVMFSSIYLHKNSRVAASEWIYKNLPNGSYILSEYWDDSLPLSITNTYGKQFTGEQLPVFDPDTPLKWQKMNEALAKADYYILSSNRGWGSIPTVPERYPLMSRFYHNLLAGKNPNYKKVIEFTSYPSLRYLGIPFDFPDQWSDESFTVYDHQMVLIYKNENHSRKTF